MSKKFYLYETRDEMSTGIGVEDKEEQYTCTLFTTTLVKVPHEGGAVEFVYKRPINDTKDIYKGFLVEHNELYELGCINLEEYYGEEDYDIVLVETDLTEEGDPLFVWFHY